MLGKLYVRILTGDAPDSEEVLKMVWITVN